MDDTSKANERHRGFISLKEDAARAWEAAVTRTAVLQQNMMLKRMTSGQIKLIFSTAICVFNARAARKNYLKTEFKQLLPKICLKCKQSYCRKKKRGFIT